MANVAWCITGGGANLRASVKVMERVKEVYKTNITLFLTRWGFEVARIFGVLSTLRGIAPGGYYQEFLVGDEGMYYIGRINLGRYRIVVIAPATANTVAKMVLGIADNIASTLYSQALKSRIPVVVLPTDMPSSDGYIESETPCYVDKNLCNYTTCGECASSKVCPVNAIVTIGQFMRIDLSKCIGCERCVYTCPTGAIKCWEKIRLMPREIDVENIDTLKRQPYTYVIKDAYELEKML
ncbi:MAG: flavoprotein [Desulfurococcaceae archaeon]|nr:4Fe-4S binding protein [Sulfolobales archaeon]MDW8170150.1 flavoprotein [Desulfurococcaceae archaeon]